jgi:hypothetical protein
MLAQAKIFIIKPGFCQDKYRLSRKNARLPHPRPEIAALGGGFCGIFILRLLNKILFLKEFFEENF